MNLRSEIKFWRRQICEHHLLMGWGLGVELDKIKSFKDLKNTLQYLWGTQLLDQTLELHRLWKDVTTLSEVNRLTLQSKNFMKHLMCLHKDNFQGFLFEGFLNHMLEELEYFSSKVNGVKKTLPEELEWWVNHNKTELGLVCAMISEDEVLEKKYYQAKEDYYISLELL